MSVIIIEQDEFGDEDDDDDDEYKTLKDVSILEDFTLDDETPTTLPKDPFPPISSIAMSRNENEKDLTNKDIASSDNPATFYKQFATIGNTLGNDEKILEAISSYNSNTPSGQETVMVPFDNTAEEETDIVGNDIKIRDSVSISKQLVQTRECRGYIQVTMNLRRPINVLPGTRPPSTYTITSSKGIKAMKINIDPNGLVRQITD